jgi:hypothetical protein
MNVSGNCPNPPTYNSKLLQMSALLSVNNPRGPYLSTEKVLAFSIGTNSTAQLNAVEFVVSKFGIITTSTTEELLFVSGPYGNTGPTGIQGVTGPTGSINSSYLSVTTSGVSGNTGYFNYLQVGSLLSNDNGHLVIGSKITTNYDIKGTTGSFHYLKGTLEGNAATATTATNIANGNVGQIPYNTAIGATTFLDNNNTTNYVLTSTGVSAPVWKPNISIFANVLNNGASPTRIIQTSDYYNLILFNITTTVIMPETPPPNLTYIKFSIIGNNLLTIVSNSGTNIVVLTPPPSNFGSAGVTLMYSTVPSFTGWFVVQ